MFSVPVLRYFCIYLGNICITLRSFDGLCAWSSIGPVRISKSKQLIAVNSRLMKGSCRPDPLTIKLENS